MFRVLLWGGDVPQFLSETRIKREWPNHTVFAAPPGAYVVFGDGGMAVVIIGGTPPTDPPPPPPTDPPPLPSTVQEVARSNAIRLNDAPTATALIQAITLARDQHTNSPQENQVLAVRDAISTTLLNRTGVSQTKGCLLL